MIHVTIFGGHEGHLQPDKRFYLTLFGGCELKRPTVARQLFARRQTGRNPHAENKPFFLTLFGTAGTKAPTLAEEFIDLREMISSGMLAPADWERSLLELGHTGGAIASLTIFGGFDECELPSENEEVESLAVHRHLGNIPEAAGEVLQYGIGQQGAERTATVRRAIQTAVA
jgi:hypothetical protein